MKILLIALLLTALIGQNIAFAKGSHGHHSRGSHGHSSKK